MNQDACTKNFLSFFLKPTYLTNINDEKLSHTFMSPLLSARRVQQTSSDAPVPNSEREREREEKKKNNDK